MVLHLDSGEIKTWDMMPNGNLRILSTVARTGWLKYWTPSGKEYWELVTPEILFSKEHLDSLQGCNITLDHPIGQKVSPDNWSDNVIGIASTQVIPNQREGTIDTISIIGHKKGIKAILEDGCRGISEGYDADTKVHNDSTNTLPKLEQLNRIANHYCICKDSIPRAGDLAKLHLDSIGNDIAYQIDWDEASTNQIFDLKPKVNNQWQILNVIL